MNNDDICMIQEDYKEREESVWSGSCFAESTKKHSHFEIFSAQKRQYQLGPIAKRYSRRLDHRSHLQLQHSTNLIPFTSNVITYGFSCVISLYTYFNNALYNKDNHR